MVDLEIAAFKSWCARHLEDLKLLGEGNIPSCDDVKKALDNLAPKLAKKAQEKAINCKSVGMTEDAYYLDLFRLYLPKEKKDGHKTPSVRPAPPKISFPKWEYTIEGESQKKMSVLYYMRPNGIFTENTIYRDDDEGGPITLPELCVWTWKEFGITSVLREEEETGTEFRYDFRFNGENFLDKSREDLINIVYVGCYPPKYKQLLSPFIDLYIAGQNVPVVPYSKFAGFFEDGWHFSDKYHIRFTDAQLDCRAGLKAMVNLVIDPETVKRNMIALYTAVSVAGKAVPFAWAMAAPFFHVLKQYTDMMPFLFFYSADGGSGKSWLANVLTARIWNNIKPGEIAISKDQFNSPARANAYLSTSTLPVALDDIQDLMDAITTILKVHFTGLAGYMRMNPKQGIQVNKDLLAPVVGSYNQRPILLLDPAMLQRGLEKSVTSVTMPAQQKAFKDAYFLGPRGDIGKYIYQLTAAWTVKDIIERFNRTEDWKEAPDARANNQYKLYELGAMLFEEWFGIALDVSEAKLFIAETRNIVCMDWFGTMLTQLRDGVKKEVVIGSGEHEHVEMLFKPSERWIMSEIIRCTHQNIPGFLYQASNARDLARCLNVKYSMELPLLYTQMVKKWKGAVMLDQKKVRADEKWENKRGIFIPESVFSDTEIDLEEFSAEQLKVKALVGQAKGAIMTNITANPGVQYTREELLAAVSAECGPEFEKLIDINAIIQEMKANNDIDVIEDGSGPYRVREKPGVSRS